MKSKMAQSQKTYAQHKVEYLAELGLIFIAFNLRRIFNLIDPNLMKKHLIMPDFVFDGFINNFKAVVKEYIFSYPVFGFCNLQFNRS